MLVAATARLGEHQLAIVPSVSDKQLDELDREVRSAETTWFPLACARYSAPTSTLFMRYQMMIWVRTSEVVSDLDKTQQARKCDRIRFVEPIVS